METVIENDEPEGYLRLQNEILQNKINELKTQIAELEIECDVLQEKNVKLQNGVVEGLGTYVFVCKNCATDLGFNFDETGLEDANINTKDQECNR